jgi:hypothetical protein
MQAAIAAHSAPFNMPAQRMPNMIYFRTGMKKERRTMLVELYNR